MPWRSRGASAWLGCSADSTSASRGSRSRRRHRRSTRSGRSASSRSTCRSAKRQPGRTCAPSSGPRGSGFWANPGPPRVLRGSFCKAPPRSLISGEGEIHLDSETIELALHGQPKHRHLMRLQAPVLVGGTLSHPSLGMQGGNGAAQTTKAIAVGIARTPLEILGFVDADLAKNADCASLLQSAKNQGVPVKSSDQPSQP